MYLLSSMNTITNQTSAKPVQRRIGIIGGGLAGFMMYVVLRFRGVPAADIAVFSTSTHPAEEWLSFVRPINQRHMRSESAAHFFPTDSPGLATVELFTKHSIKPLLMSWFDLYHPTVETILQHINALVEQTGYASSLVLGKISRIERYSHTVHIYDSNDQLQGVVDHLVLAVGHGKISIPPVIADYQQSHPNTTSVQHSFFHTQEYTAGTTVMILGNGLTAATEWANALAADAKVIAVCPMSFTMEQPLNTPRRYFSLRGIFPYRHQAARDRLRELAAAKRGTFPPYRHWKKMFAEAQSNGQLRIIEGVLESIEDTAAANLRGIIRLTDKQAVTAATADTIIAATGFAAPTTNPLLNTIITQYNLPLVGPCLALEDDYTIAALSYPDSLVGVIGSAADWAIPCADSFGGIKIVAHTLANRIVGEESWHPQALFTLFQRWLTIIRGKQLV
jgi:hypothetical protein